MHTQEHTELSNIKLPSSYNDHSSIGRLSVLPGTDIYFYQAPAMIRQIWTQAAVLDFRPMASFFFRRVCGMPEEAASLYLNDTSGNMATPLPGSNVPQALRVHRMIYESDRRALTGPGLAPTFERYKLSFESKTSRLAPSGWVAMDDLGKFIHDTVGVSVMESIFGSTLMEMHPDLMDKFSEFEEAFPSIIKGFAYSRAQRIRHSLLYYFRSWSRHTEKRLSHTPIHDNEEHDPFWGTAWTRYRHTVFKTIIGDDATASHDLGVTWGYVFSLIPSLPC